MATAMRTTRLPRVLPAQPRLAHTTTPCALPCLTTVRLPHRAPKTACRVQQKDTSDVQPTIATPSTSTSTALVGEDAAAFDLAQQSATSWGVFVALLTGVLALIFVVWINPSTGIADEVVGALSSITHDSTTTMVAILIGFAFAHSGLAFLRPYGEDLIGARAYRVIFALVSLPLAILAVVYFINHRYDGVALWNIRGLPLVHESVWILTFVSFFFLYPSTFNILEVAAVDKPKLHLWETGIMRITRHPQMVGQALWCLAHTAWIGSSFMVATSATLLAHHLFSVWHGDYRLKRKHGEAFEAVKARTSVIPFTAILDGRQQLPQDYYKEFLRLPYVTITAITIGAYLCHPLMQQRQTGSMRSLVHNLLDAHVLRKKMHMDD